MQPVVHSLFRQSLRAAGSLTTTEEHALAKQRFAEFLPPRFIITNDTESMVSIVRRSFRHPYQHQQETIKAVSSAFSFLKAFQSERVEIEVLAHWARRGSDSLSSAPTAAQSASGKKKPSTSSVSKAGNKNVVSPWLSGAAIISFAYQSACSFAKSQHSLPHVSPQSASHESPLKSQKCSIISSTDTHLSTKTYEHGMSFDTFVDRLCAQIDAITNKVRSSLLLEQLVLAAQTTGKKPVKKKVKEHKGASIINTTTSDAGVASVSKMTAKAAKQRASLTPQEETKLLAGVEVESIVRAIVKVLLVDMQFTAVTVSPLDGFLIDRALDSRVASTSLLSLLFAVVGSSLGLECSVTMDQRCPFVRVEGFSGLTCFVNFADGGTILSPNEALELHVKSVQKSQHSRTALKAGSPNVVFCGILASLLVATGSAKDDPVARDSEVVRQVLKAQLMFLARGGKS